MRILIYQHISLFIFQEGKDKQFLLAKLADATGEGRKKAPAPQLRTVNEINNKHMEVTISSFHLSSLMFYSFYSHG